MTLQSILLPLFVQIGLTYFLAWLARQQRGLILRKEVRWQDIALRQKPGAAGEPFVPEPIRGSGCILCPRRARAHCQKADFFFVAMEWLFVATRIAHAYVHTTSNYVPLRGQFFIAGVIILFLMWGFFAFRILAGP